MDEVLLRALLTMVLVGISCSLIGSLLVCLKISFLGICMSHTAFLGVLISLLLGINPLIGATVLTIITCGIIGPASIRSKVSPETIIGIIFSSLMGIAFIIMKYIPNSSDALNYLWGSILTITKENIIILSIISIIFILLLIFFYKQISIVLFDRTLATSLGIKGTLIFYLILIGCGLVTSTSIGAIGGLLVFSLILNPAVSAYQLTYSLMKMFFLSVLFGLISSIGGLFISWWLDLPVGASVVVLSTLIYVVTLIFRKK